MSGVSWSLRFQQSISTWPCTNDLGSAAVQVILIFYPNLEAWLQGHCYLSTFYQEYILMYDNNILQETICGACEREKSSTMVQMYGQPYNQNTLKSVPPDETARLHRVRKEQSLLCLDSTQPNYWNFILSCHVLNYIFSHTELLSLQEVWSFSGIIPSTTPSETQDAHHLFRSS